MIRTTRFNTALLFSIGVALTSLATGAEAQTEGEESAFITRLGSDTVAIEVFERTPDGYEAIVLRRSPEFSLRWYSMVPGGEMGGPILRTVEMDPVSLGPVSDDPADAEQVEMEGSDIPFIDMVHWPFQLMVERALETPQPVDTVPLFTGRRTFSFVLAEHAEGRWSFTHPTRGTMEVMTNGEGRVMSIDATETTRALVVERVPADDLPFPELAADFAARDERGEGMGELSGRGETEAFVGDASFLIDYGVPLTRGREIFGGLLPFGEVWRTGANRATHFTTTGDLLIDGEILPAGEYTLFTRPGEESWTLMINSRTDINGQAYDPDADVLRVEMEVRALDEVVEPLTILVDETGDDEGVLRIRWDRTEAYLPFEVVG